jgi:hypothetical protein
MFCVGRDDYVWFQEDLAITDRAGWLETYE